MAHETERSKAPAASSPAWILGNCGDQPLESWLVSRYTREVIALGYAVAGQKWAVSLEAVIEVGLRVKVAPLPGVKPPVVGIVNVRGQAVPVVSMRVRMGLPEAAGRDDHFLYVRARRTVALVVERVHGLTEIDVSRSVKVPASVEHVRGVVALEEGVLYIADVDSFLSLEEDRDIARALEG